MFARFDENPAMTLQDIKETKRTQGRTEDNVKTVYPPQTKFVGDNVKTVYPPQTKFAGGIKKDILTDDNYHGTQNIKRFFWYLAVLISNS